MIDKIINNNKNNRLSIDNFFVAKNTNLYLSVNNDLSKLEYGDLICFKGEYIEPSISGIDINKIKVALYIG